MKLKALSIFEFDQFALNHPLGSYHQTSNYAMMSSEEKGTDYELIGMIDNDNKIVAASLIIIKKLNFMYKYAYAPKGFLIDYYNENQIEEFTKLIKKRYYHKNIAFIKINPEIAIGQIDAKNKFIKYNRNQNIINTLEKYNFRKLEGNKKFDTKFPKFNSILLLKNTNINTIKKNTRNKINKSKKYGLTFEKTDRTGIDILYNFIRNKKDHKIDHYYNYYNAFSKNDSIDIFLVKINFEKALINLREKYEKEFNKNQKLVENVMQNQTETNLKKKLESDRALRQFNDAISETTFYLRNKTEEYIAGAITIKYKNRVSILISGFNKKYKLFNANYFLHNEIINYYKNDYEFLDLNGITGDFSDENPYKGLNEFKLGWNPISFEYIGEFDYIINEGLYKNLEQNGTLTKEFKRKEKSINI